jgi:3-methyladenine DNA glycosylase Tag
LIATRVSPPSTVAAIPDDRILAEMSRWIFYAGFSVRVVDVKWPSFERAFSRFDLSITASMDDGRIDALSQNPNIIRNRRKIRAVRTNAQLLLDFARSGGSAAHFLAQWPDEDYADLLHLLKLRGSHLTGHAAMRFLRAIGKPAFILTDDVVDALTREKVIARAPRTREDRAAVQAAFNVWARQSGRNLTEISRILAMSVAGTLSDARR